MARESVWQRPERRRARSVDSQEPWERGALQVTEDSAIHDFLHLCRMRVHLFYEHFPGASTVFPEPGMDCK